MKNGEQKVVHDSECGNNGAKAGHMSIVGREVDRMVVIRWLESSRNLADGGPKWRQH